MKNIIFKSAIFTAILSFTLISCGKYEEGPKLSLRSKKARVSGDWTLEQYLINGNDSTQAYLSWVGANFMMKIEKDGSYSVVTAFGTATGTWELGEDKDDLLLTVSGSTDSYRILKLKNKEMWLKHTDSNGVVEESHLVQ